MTATVVPFANLPPQPPPPHNAEIEAALLGAILTNNRAWERVSDVLRPEHFYEPAHGRIYEAATRLIERGQAASPLTLRQHFEKDAALEKVGGGQYLYDLAASVVSVANVEDYAERIRDMAVRRALIELCQQTAHDAADAGMDTKAAELAERHEVQLYEAMRGPEESRVAAASTEYDRMLEGADVAMKADRDIAGVPSGLSLLDRHLGGFLPGKLYIVGARPMMGKTALAVTAAWNAVNRHRPGSDSENCRVMFFSAEMSGAQIMMRVGARIAGLSVEDIQRGRISMPDFDRLAQAREQVAKASLTIDASSMMTVSQIRTRARRHQRRHGLDLIVVDYIGLLQASAATVKSGNKVLQVSEITRDLKLLAGDLDVPVVALSQLNRQLESRDDKRPTLADLRDSGSIEQDADVVMFIYREEEYLRRDEPKQQHFKNDTLFDEAFNRWGILRAKAKGRCEIIVAKNRQGATGTVTVRFDGPATAMYDLDAQDERQEGLDV